MHLFDGISIVVCCYNSEKRLPQTLLHLSQQRLMPGLSFEVIVVDNNSSDNTSKIAKEIWASANSQINCKIISQSKSGLNHARVKGVEESKYDIICFCDDDNWLSENYVLVALDIFNSHPSVGIVGGNATPVFESIEPEWFGKYVNYFACGGQYYHTGNITKDKGWVYGAGFCIRKDAFYANKVKLVTTDRLGNSLASGGDTEIGYLAVLNGWQVWYDDQLRFNHFIALHRCELGYLKKLVSVNDVNSFYLDGLAYRAGYHLDWYKLAAKRTWIYLLFRNVFKLSEWVRFKNLGLGFSLHVQFKKVCNIIRWNTNYDKSFRH